MKSYTVGAKRAAKRGKTKADQPQWSGEAAPKAEPLGPTLEAQQHGEYEKSDTGVTVNKAASPLRRAHSRRDEAGRRILSIEQVEAGEWMEALYAALNGSAGPRSCLDWSVPGRSETETESERIVRIWQEYKHVRRLMGTRVATVVFSVAVLHEPIGDCRPEYRRFRMLVEGLDVLVRYREGK